MDTTVGESELSSIRYVEMVFRFILLLREGAESNCKTAPCAIFRVGTPRGARATGAAGAAAPLP